MQWRDDTTLLSRGLGLRPISKSSESPELPLGSKPLKLRTSKGLPVFPADIGDGLPDFRLLLTADIASKSTRRRPSADARASRPDAIRIERKCNCDEMRPPTRRPQRG